MPTKHIAIGARPPADPQADAWVRRDEGGSAGSSVGKRALYTARLTLDVTPAQRASIKVAAFRQGRTVADMLRVLLAREFPENPS